MSHIADIETEDGIALHLNTDGNVVSLTASRAHPTERDARMALAVTNLTAPQLLKLADACQGAARVAVTSAPGEPSNDPKAFDEIAAAQYRADIAEAALEKKGRKS